MDSVTVMDESETEDGFTETLSEETKRLERLAEKINWSVLKTFGEEVCLWMNDCLGLQTLVSPIGDLNSQES